MKPLNLSTQNRRNDVRTLAAPLITTIKMKRAPALLLGLLFAPLAALLATSGGVAELEGSGGDALHSSAVQACVAMGAQSDLQSDRIKALSRQPQDPFYRPFLGGNAINLPEIYALASPRSGRSTASARNM
jgi:hypothetical protein